MSTAHRLIRARGHAASDLNWPRAGGVAWADLAIAVGQRVSPADAYLRPVLDRPNGTVLTGALVTGLRLRHGRCTGIGYWRDGAPALAETSGEGGRVHRRGRHTPG